jgi:hypothetical protein
VLVENWLGDTFVDGDFRPIPLASGMCGLRVSQLPRYAGLVRAFGIRHRVGKIFIYLDLDSDLDLLFIWIWICILFFVIFNWNT